ncbi:ComEC/Rec2 family competence protein [Streptomyces morookaense]|uniref:ComEC/Rec2 family competence protein n=1 Tax=Streptomyces morookaense TaxID=1970 RepID=UPI003F68406C
MGGARQAVPQPGSVPDPAAAPSQDPPPDLRLVGPAVAAWVAAALALGASPFAVTLVCTVALAMVAVLLARHRTSATAVALAAGLLCACAGATAGALAGTAAHRGLLPQLARRAAEVTLEATVTGDPRTARAGATVVLEADATRLDGPAGTAALRTPVLVLADRHSWLDLLPSTRLRLTGRLTLPTRGGSADRIAAVVRVAGQEPPHVIAPPTALQRAAARLRSGLRRATDGLAPDARALLPGLVVGDTSRIPADLDDAFRATDLTHLLAVSGGNFTILLALLIGPSHLSARAERRGIAARLGLPLRLTALLGGALSLGFVVVCRPDPSVLRAAACGLITLLALGTGRRRSLLPALAAAVLLLVLFDPWLARSYGFLLSVLATAALLTLAPRWSEALQRRGVRPRLAEALAAAGAAQAVCGPVIALLAAQVSLVAVPCNLLSEPAVAAATVLGFAAMAAAPVALPAAKCLAWLAGWPASWTAVVARTGAALPGAALPWPAGWPGCLLLAAVTAAAVLAARRVRLLRRPWVCAGLALLLLLAVVRPAPLTRVVTGWPPSGWRLAVCDVGQGDALVLAAGEGTAVVVDAGPDPHAVDGCLRGLQVERVPLLVLSHFHADHVDGLPGVLHGRAVGMIETTPFARPPGRAAFVRRAAAQAGVPVAEGAAGERRRLGDLSWEVLWPPPAGTSAAAEDGPNDASLVLLVRTAGLTLLLLGDLEPPAQQALVEAYPGLPPVDVLKVAHHGSAHQDAQLLRALHPRLALISVGAHNRYGHPAAATVAALKAQGAAVLRTDTDGAVAVTGSATAVTAGRGRRRRTGARCRGCVAWCKTDSWIPPVSMPTSVASAFNARPPPMRRRCASSNSGTSSPCRSRTCRSIWERRSCWRARPSWRRWCRPGAAASAMSSTAPSPTC